MNILAIDTSSNYLSLALAVDNQCFETLDNVGNKQSHHIINKIKSLLTIGGIKIQDVDLIAYIKGPGSFTGLRVGLSVALGIAFGNDIKLVPISIFALYAVSSKTTNNVLIGIDARLEQMYLALVNPITLNYIIQPQLICPQQIVTNDNCVLIGNGFQIYWDQLPYNIKQHQLLDQDYPNAKYMLDIIKLNKYPPVSPDMADLMYLRNKVALPLKEQRNQNLSR